MTKAAKSELQKLLELIVDSAEKRVSHLPPKQAAAARKKIRRIAAATAARGRGKSPQAEGKHARRTSSRSRAKSS